jgi:ABC-2 type transport system ATP-binding protein
MSTGRRRTIVAAVVAATAILAAASPAFARDGVVTSFDGTKIVYSFFPATGLAAGQTAPTVMDGPGYSMSRASDTDTTVATLLAAGYNVVTWDPRGFGDSGGNVEVDSPAVEGRDAQALIDMIAEQPEAQLDKPGDPRLGMIGASYGGGIQYATAQIDPRVDVITPQIAWHSLVTSLDKNNTSKGGWGVVLFGLGEEGTTVPGVTGGLSGQPAGFQFGRMQDPESTQAITDGLTTGELTAPEQAFFAARGPGDNVSKVTIPTLISQGTDDTLFTLHEGIENYEAQKAAGAPVSMIWFCGGLTDPSIAHGICLDSKGPDPGIVLEQSVKWLNHYLRHETSVDTGPAFRWVSDVGTLHGAASYPPPQGTPLTGSGSGALTMVPGDTSGTLIAATKAVNAVNVALAKPADGTQLLGEPTLTLAYSGLAASADGRVYAQLISNATGRPLGNQVTPIEVTLDGQPHTTTLPIEAVASDAGPTSTYTLQLTDGTSDYFAARQAGLVTFSKIAISVPTVAAGGSFVIAPAPGAATSSTGSASGSASGSSSTHPKAIVCTSRRAFSLHLRARYRRQVRSARILLGTHVLGRFATPKRAVRIDLKGRTGTVDVRIVMALRNGRHVTDTRRYHLCAKKR